MDQSTKSIAGPLTLYGLPAVIGLFYFHLALNFEYTPESTFSALVSYSAWSASEEPLSSLWMVIPFVSSLLSLDALLALKIFGIVCSCTAIFVTFLLAFEVTGEKVVSFCAAFATGFQWWLLQVGASGNIVPLALVLTMGSLYFVLRNEYLMATILAGLFYLVCWQSVVLLPIILLDLSFNSRSMGQARNKLVFLLVVYVIFIASWFAFSGFMKTTPWTQLFSFEDWSSVWLLVISALLFIASVPAFIKVEREELMKVLPLGLWSVSIICLGFLTQPDFYYTAMPILTVLSFAGLITLMSKLRPAQSKLRTSLLLASLFLAVNQFIFHMSSYAKMEETRIETSELYQIGTWLKANAAGDATVVAERHGTLSYYSGLVVKQERALGHPEYLVLKDKESGPYEKIFSPEDSFEGRTSSGFALWKLVRESGHTRIEGIQYNV